MTYHYKNLLVYPALALALAAGLISCKERKESVAQSNTEAGSFSGNYQCGDTVLSFTSGEDGRADLHIGSTSYAMQQVMSASGAKYDNMGDPDTVFWSKGDKAFVTLNGKELPECSLLPEEQKKVTAPLQQGDDIRNVEWRLEKLNGSGIIDKSHITLQLGEDNLVAGSSGCNRYNSQYEMKEATLTIKPQIAATMMACPPSLMEQERKFLETLPKIQNYYIDETSALILTGQDETVLTFRTE